MLGAPSISQEWLKLELSNFVQRETISSLPTGWQITPKRGVILLTWHIFVCRTVDCEHILHGTPLTEIHNVVDDGLLLIVPTALEATLKLRPKLHQFDFLLYLLQTWLCSIPPTNPLSGVWIIVQICGNNQHFSSLKQFVIVRRSLPGNWTRWVVRYGCFLC